MPRKDNKGRKLRTGESQRKDGLYMYRYTDSLNNRKCIYDTNLASLRLKEDEILRDQMDGICPEKGSITLNEQFNKYVNIKKVTWKNSTLQHNLYMWEHYVKSSSLGQSEIKNIRMSDVLEFYSRLSLTNKNSTIDTIHLLINPCMQLAVDDNIIRKNPCKGVMKHFKPDRKKRFALTLEQQTILIDFIKNSQFYPRLYTIVTIMIGTAVRAGELTGLTWNDIDFENRTISIDHQLRYEKVDGKYRFRITSPKSSAGVREIPMTKEVYKLFKMQREIQFSSGSRTDVVIDGYEDFCFSTKNKKPLSLSGLNSSLSYCVKAYNDLEIQKSKVENRDPFLLPPISSHILRHTGCTRMAETGIDIKVLQSIMGHESISVLMQIYNHVDTKRTKKELEKLDRLTMFAL